MWFKFPEGASAITVQQQGFIVEFTDEQGREYFRAPDHFSTTILSIPGFALAMDLKDAPADLPKADPLRDGAIAELTKSSEAMKIEVQNLRSDLAVATSRIVALSNENSDLKASLAKSETVVEELK